VLTYFAISLAAVPIILNQAWKERPAAQAQVVKPPSAPGSPAYDSSAANTAPDAQTQPTSDTSAATSQQPSEGQAAQTATEKPTKKMNLAVAIGYLMLIGVASPFLELQSPLHGLIGLFILFIGLRIAWQMTAAKALDVDGPFSATGQAG
jgi:hypothetical protein